MGLVSIDRDSFESYNTFIYTVQGNRLIITGNDCYKHGTREARYGDPTKEAAYYFLVNKFGLELYDDEELDMIRYSPDPVISLDDGYLYTDEPFFKHRIFYMSGNILSTEEPKVDASEQLYNYLTGDFGSYEHNYDPTPCLTDENNLTTMLGNIRLSAETDPELSKISIGICDSPKYCKCTGCMAMYREYKSRSATIVNLANLAAKELEAIYADFEVEIGAYTYTATPPVGMELHKNITVRYITIEACAGHTYDDPDCQINKAMYDELIGWYELTNNKLHFWDHSGAFVQFMTPFPDWNSQLHNIQFLADHSYEESGILMNSVFGGKHPDFGQLRCYLFSIMYLDPYMSEEEYNYHLNNALEVYYGDGWKYLREYIDTIAELGNEKCHSFHAPASAYYDYTSVAAKADELDALWDKAAALAEGTELERLTLARHSWIYLRQSATQKDRYEMGTEKEKAEFVAANKALYNYVMENDVIWTEAVHGSLADCDFTKGPDTWQIGG